MNVVVHRLRHLEYTPHPIVCLRATPCIPNSDSSFVALSRENGGVELKAPNEKFRTIAEIAGYKNKVINAMAWLCGSEDKAAGCQPTLVGGSRDGTLFVVDFNSGTLTGVMASGGGGVFCLASLCQSQTGACCAEGKKQECVKLVAAGCEDGSVRIFKAVSRSSLELISIIPSASAAAILSVAWRRITQGGIVLFAGVADGTIRRFDWEPNSDNTAPNKSRNYTSGRGTWKSVLRMTVESLGRNTPTQVWALQVLSDGTVISGDSLGHVQFWDGDTGTLTQSFDQNDSKADVFEIAVASEECKAFASGVDSRVVCIERTAVEATPTGTSRKWILSHVQRPHTHDVKAITVCRQRARQVEKVRSLPSDSNTASTVEILCTGGIDTKLCTYHVAGFKKLRPRSLYPWPAFSPVAQANCARVLILRREGQIDLYKLEDSPPQQPPKESFAVPEDDTRIGVIELDSSCNLACATISDDGRFLAACDANSLFVFRLQYVTNSQGTTVVPTKLSPQVKGKASFVSLKFGGNDQLFAAASDGRIHVINMPADDSIACTQAMVLVQKQSKVRHKDSLFPVLSMVFSEDKRWFAAFQGGLDHSYIRIFAVDNDSRQYHPWWALPDLEAPVTALRFLGSGKSPELVVSCSNFAFYHFDIMGRQLSKWSEESGVPVSKHLPAELMSRNDYPIRIASNPASPAKILLGSFGAFALIDLAKTIPQECRIVPEHHVRRKKKQKQAQTTKKRGKTQKEAESVICLRYNSILHMDFVGENEMVIVEQPWLNVIATFPAPLERKIYAS